ncbi:MAG: hypothetical protein KAG64_08215 [Bacteroidales bacterium]|nr:hypothetical protein [Bacteroidales bacterium]
MIKFSDLLLVFIEALVYFVLAIAIVELTAYPFLALPLFLLFFIIHLTIKRRKKILKFVEKDFRKRGFELTDEKPIPFSDSEISIKPSAEISGLPIGRFGYMRRFGRIFTAKTNDGQLMELKARVTKKWNGEIEINIDDQEEI